MDFVFDKYLENSIKTQTREGRGKRIPISVRRDTPLREDLKTFMTDSYNKAELFLMIANSISQIRDVPTSIIATVKRKFLMVLIYILKILSNQQEADPRLILVLMKCGLNTALVSTKGGYQYVNMQSA